MSIDPAENAPTDETAENAAATASTKAGENTAPAESAESAESAAPAAAPESGLTLAGSHILLTGATGFVGQAVLERLLSDHPDTRVTLLIRGKGSLTGEARLKTLLRKPVFSALRDRIGADALAQLVSERVGVIEGGLQSLSNLPTDIDVVIHGASTVSFDPPIDEAFDTNVGGATSLYGALLASGSDPHVVHVSTAYVGGIRKGIAPEASLEHTVDWRAEADAASSARARVELASRQPESLRKAIALARARHGKTGPQAVAAAAEALRDEWVKARLVDYGRTRAESLGWTDVYTLTKAFAERAAEELWAGNGHRLSVVRPSIIESALRHPFPGWIDGFKVADPLILAYGRGQLPEFPGVPDSILDIIPVDFVVSAILAVAATPPEPKQPQYFHVSSGASNPLPFHRMYENVKEFFTATPMPHESGHIQVPSWQFPGGRRVEQALRNRERATAAAEKLVMRLPSTSRTRVWLGSIAQNQHELESLRMYSDLYRAYVQTEIVFDDARTRALDATLPADDPNHFDVTAIDWEDYLQRVHFTAITTLTRAFASRPASRERVKKALVPGSDVLAVFDLEGTVLRSNIVEQYLWLKLSRIPKAKWPGEVASLTASLPRYLAAERRDRGEFIRAFMRRYEGFSIAEIEKQVAGAFGDTLRSKAMGEALDRVREHREAGHRTVLVTGAIDLIVAPLAPLFDEVVSGRMHDRDGVLTGYLERPPLVDEARAAWLRQYALAHGIDLKKSFGYGDSHADLVWLQLLGHPNAVNPDTELYRHAQRSHWTVYDWGDAPRGDHGAFDRIAKILTLPGTTVDDNTRDEEGEQAERRRGA